MNRRWRDYFDGLFEEVMRDLPREARRLLSRTPIYVEDQPSKKIMREMEIEDPRDLQGLAVGGEFFEERLDNGGQTSPAIYVYREGNLDLATDEQGYVDEEELRKQIRITILHELGHLRGLDEEELRRLGYG